MTNNTELIGCVSHDCAACKKRDVALDAAQAENKEVKRLQDAWQKEATELLAERDAALARIAELSKQEPVAYRFTENRGNGKTEFNYYGLDDVGMAYRDNCLEITSLYAAAGASPQPAEPVGLSDTQRIDFLDENKGSNVLSLAGSWYTRPGYGQPYKKRTSLRYAVDAAINAKGAAS